MERETRLVRTARDPVGPRGAEPEREMPAAPVAAGPAAGRDAALRDRARRVIPGGMYGHQNAAAWPAPFRQFLERGRGCRIWDVDGREYVDFMSSFGPNHPWHNWFLSAAHRDADVKLALERTDEAFAAVRARFEPDA